MAKPYTPAAKPEGMMNDNPVLPCWIVGTTVALCKTMLFQSVVPDGMNAIRALLLASVKAPLSKTDSPGAVSREIQKTALVV